MLLVKKALKYVCHIVIIADSPQLISDHCLILDMLSFFGSCGQELLPLRRSYFDSDVQSLSYRRKDSKLTVSQVMMNYYISQMVDQKQDVDLHGLLVVDSIDLDIICKCTALIVAYFISVKFY